MKPNCNMANPMTPRIAAGLGVVTHSQPLGCYETSPVGVTSAYAS